MKLVSKLYKVFYLSSSERYLNFLRRKGVSVGDGTVVFDPKHIDFDSTRPSLLKIGKHVFLHKNTVIMTHDWTSWCFMQTHNDFIPSHAKVTIGDNVWLGMGVTILKGVEIGDNVIIGAGSVVSRSIPSNSVAAGIPAKVICSYEEYYNKRKIKYLDEFREYATSLIESGKGLNPEYFSDDYPPFINKSNFDAYDYPYLKSSETRNNLRII